MPQTPRPFVLRSREGDVGHGNSRERMNPEHPAALPDKPTYLSPEAGEFWDDYLRFCAPGLLRLVHGPALAQLCEDRVLETRLRRSVTQREEVILSRLEARLKEKGEKGDPADSRDELPGGPLGAYVETEEGSRLFRTLNQVIQRIQRQEQQFGLTPQGACKVDIASTGSIDNALEEGLG